MSYQHPVVDQINECLGLWLVPEEDFPCTICRFCSASLEAFEAFRERSKDCDLALRKSRLGPVNLSDFMEFGIGEEIKVEPLSPSHETVNEQTSELASTSLSNFVNNSEQEITIETDNNSECVSAQGVLDLESPASQPVAPKQHNVKIRIVHANGRNVRKPPKGPPPPEYTCDYCGRPFSFKGFLTRHLLECHIKKQQAAKAKAKTGKDRSTDPPVPAKIVPISPKELRKQMNLYSGPVVTKYKNSSSRHTCNLCPARFYSLGLYIVHRAQVHGKPLGKKASAEWNRCLK
ncbi:uncharacterized protein LOC131437286 isoform X2 [Malaya genurostris]|nr:uncharacterized protein LOC131437286 isoform X2 [Malaya genurostris]